MYNFTELNQNQTGMSFLPSVAMEIDGVFIENEIVGYRTLTVEGREHFSTNINSIGMVSGLDGSIFLSETMPNKLIRVKFKLEADSSEEFQLKFNKLKAILKSKRNETVKVSFKDEIDFYYDALVSGIEGVNPGGNTTIGVIVISVNPFKYSKELREATGSSVLVSLDYKNTITFEKITVDINFSTNLMSLSNTTKGYHLSILGPFQTGDKVEIDFIKKTITLNNTQNILNRLVFESSRFTDFYIDNGDTITIDGNVGNMKCKWRDKIL